MVDLDAVELPARQLLGELIGIPTTRGNEGAGMVHLHEVMRQVTTRSLLVPIDGTIVDDPLYAFPLPGHSYEETPNLECVIEGRGEGPPIVFNTHMDVVPASDGQDDAFTPTVRDGKVYGRGACDAKGQIATLYALALLQQQSGPPPVDVVFHVVVEEEVGGNGTLAMVRRGVNAQAAVVLEPSDLAVFAAVRGAVWFRLRTFGQAGHSGAGGQRISALDGAVQAMSIFRDYHDALLARSRDMGLFDTHDDPMPITFGQCTAGNWPASVPSEATLTGVLGFLPNVDHRLVQREMDDALRRRGDVWLRERCDLSFPMLNNDGYALPEDHRLVTALTSAAAVAGAPTTVKAMTASCDAWLYHNVARIPTLVYGPGSLTTAHGKDEHVLARDIVTAAATLHEFVMNHVGVGDGVDHDRKATRHGA